MATTSYTIYSHYDPATREQLERDTGQLPSESLEDDIDKDSELEWQTESAKAFKQRAPPPPRFVRASGSGWSSSLNSSSPGAGSSSSTSDSKISGWYRSIIPDTNTDPSPSPSRSTSVPQNPPAQNPKHQAHKPTISKNDWFIQKALPTPSPTRTPTPTLADLLARNPPPPPNTKFKPPGWREGEVLGADVVRRNRTKQRKKVNGRNVSRVNTKETQEEIEIQLGDGDGEITEIRKVDVVDLTADSDFDLDSEAGSEAEAEPDDEQDSNADDIIDPRTQTSHVVTGHRTALLTPIPTVLKSDRLGIGLKAKTVGPYKASMKRVTHNAAALAAHYKRAEEARIRKGIWGKGRRGFARKDKQERERRREMLRYFNE
ncbi:hypothetical protein BDP27DRAFT_1311780 [Rhodocollybia butyracea]|uniref:Uncharacterized protein n=1 Tax=Rhodocollybia butyracea TaxID=206335 RepID=A0A9P5QAT0_9AGAR|nr:hypothetical protein BDP27DRAFT_1311780 [Rhodocollybia butyracea]